MNSVFLLIISLALQHIYQRWLICICTFQVLLLIDASFGFEMEIFEFLNVAQVHGFPKIMGVLTHLDLMKNNKSLQKTKKRLKNRFWTEVYQVRKLYIRFLFSQSTVYLRPTVTVYLHYFGCNFYLTQYFCPKIESISPS